MNRREIYARIALTDLPMPSTIRVYEAGVTDRLPCVVLEFGEDLDDAEQWVRWFGVEPTRRASSQDGWMYLQHDRVEWLGCVVQISGYRKPAADAPALDAELRAGLEQLVDEQPDVDQECTDPYCCPVSDERAPMAGHVPGEVYERDDVDAGALPPGVAGFPVGEGPGRHGLPFADVAPSTVVIR